MREDYERRVLEAPDLRVESRGLARVIRGYAIVFDRLSENLGGFRERIAAAAVDRTLHEGADLRALLNHDTNALPLGRLSAGTLRAEKDAHGLLVEIDPPEHAQGLVEAIKRRDVTGMSFAFRTIADEWDEGSMPPTRTVTDMLVREVSIVTFPAYPQTEVAVRSLRAWAATRTGVPRTVAERRLWSAEKFRLTGVTVSA
jgi:uncharacterized protein